MNNVTVVEAWIEAPLKQFVSEALEQKLGAGSGAHAGQPEWMQGFGKLRRLSKETERIQARIREAFEVVEPEDRT